MLSHVLKYLSRSVLLGATPVRNMLLLRLEVVNGASGKEALYSTSSKQQVTVEHLGPPHKGIAVISMNRPEARNALGWQLIRELIEAADGLKQEKTIRCVILRSLVPGCFCAGADLKARQTFTQAEYEDHETALRKSIEDIAALPVPVIAVLEGYAFGGGVELSLAADLRVMDKSSTYCFPEVRLGIMPGAGGTQRLTQLVGPARAKELMFTCAKVGWERALQLGMAEHVVETGQGYEKALGIASEIAQGAPMALRMVKASITQGQDVDINTGLKLESAYYAQLITSKDRLEGLKSFAEKRAPVFQGE